MWRDFIFIFLFNSTLFGLWPHWPINLVWYYGRKVSLYDTSWGHKIETVRTIWKKKNMHSLHDSYVSKIIISCQMAVFVVCSFPVVDGQFTTWTLWSTCSRSCGFKGFSVRSRFCTAPKHGGHPCYGAGIDTRECNRKHCPGKVQQIFTQLSYQTKKKNKRHNQFDKVMKS